MRRRILILAVSGVILLAAVILVPSPGTDDLNDTGDPPCLASRIGLPCR